MKIQSSALKKPVYVLIHCMAILLLLTLNSAIAITLNVPDDYATIQAAIDAAFDGDDIVVADGSYGGVGNTNINFNGKAITLESANGPDNCIIDSRLTGRAFYFNSSEVATSVIKGFTIQNGIIGEIDADKGGAAIYLYASSPTITNCRFKNNIALDGGVIYCLTASPTISDCIFENNSADNNGGAIYATSNSAIILKNCTIQANFAVKDGGAIYCNSSNIKIQSTLISQNIAVNGAGLYIDNSSPVLTNSIINENKASQNGGAIFCTVPDKTATAKPNIMNCTITRNSAQSGGAIYTKSSAAITVVNSILWANIMDEVGLDGKTHTAAISNSIIQGGFTGSNNIDQDPQFVGGTDFYHIKKTSPGINKGNINNAPNTDFEGNDRNLEDEAVDIGAIEYFEICDENNLDLCKEEDACVEVGGFWCMGECRRASCQYTQDDLDAARALQMNPDWSFKVPVIMFSGQKISFEMTLHDNKQPIDPDSFYWKLVPESLKLKQ